MITKTYTCDRCKATSDATNKIGLCEVTVTTSSIFALPRKAEWCGKCINKVGLSSIDDLVEMVRPVQEWKEE